MGQNVEEGFLGSPRKKVNRQVKARVKARVKAERKRCRCKARLMKQTLINPLDKEHP